MATPSYNFDSAAGIRYTVDVSKPTGEKICIESMADDSPFDLQRRIAVPLTRIAEMAVETC